MIPSAKAIMPDISSSSINHSGSISDDLLRLSTSEDEPEIPVLSSKKYPQSIIAHDVGEEGQVKYLIKFRNRSYYELEWLNQNDLLDLLPNVSLIRNYEKFQNMSMPTLAPFFNHKFIIPEKIITEQVCQGQIKYLVKWAGLDYDECTWESIIFFEQHHSNLLEYVGFEKQENDIDLDAIFNEILNKYHAQSIKPSDEELRIPNRPNPKSFSVIDQEYFPKSKSGYEIRSYQVEGVNFMMKQWYNRKNAILADEMGLGKTLQSLMFLNMLSKRQKIWGPFLVIVPLSTISNWEREATEWTNLRYLSFYGSKIRRNLILQNELFYVDTNILKTQLLFTTYEYAVKMSDLFSKVEWQAIIIDEAHRIKNHKSKLFSSIIQFKTEFKLLLTGTPLQNNIGELWSLLHYLDSEEFNSSQEFNEKFGNLNETQQVTDLQKILRPLMLRRLKGDVEKSISPVEEIIIECPMSQHQMAYYSSIYQQNVQYLTRGAHNKWNVNFHNICMELRKCCNHPYLINGAEDQILVERREAEKLKDNNNNTEEQEQNEEKFELESLIRSSGKMILLDKLLAKLKKDGHRILIFSQMVKMLDIIQDYLLLKGYQSQRIDGCIRGEDRQRAIDEFNNPNSTDFIFLLGTKAGGVGINLASADTVIIYDSDWNPQNDIQATARCHRIGQTKDVKVYRFLTANSYERTLFNKASLKLGLDTAVLSQESKKLTPKQAGKIEKMLKLGAYYAFAEESKDKEEMQKINEEDIDSILKRSQRIKYDHTASSVEGSTFSKLQFEIEPDSNLDLAAPNFWKKYIPKETKQMKLIKKKVLNKQDEKKTKQRPVYTDHKSNDLNSESESDNDDDFEDYSDSSSSSKKSRKNQRIRKSKSNQSLCNEGDIEENCEVSDWTEKEIDSLLKLLMNFGLGRWEFLFDHSENLKINRTPQDFRRVSLSIVQYLIKSDNSRLMNKEKSFLEEIFLNTQNTNLLEFIERFNSKHESILKKVTSSDQNNSISLILLLYFLNEIINSCKDPPNDIPIPSLSTDIIQKPYKWWSDKDDKLLLFHIWKNGFNEFTNIQLTHSFNEKASISYSKKRRKKNDVNLDDEDDNNVIPEYVKYFLSQRVMKMLLEIKQLFTTYRDRIKSGNNVVFNSKTLIKAINMMTIKEQREITTIICNMGINNLNKCYSLFSPTKRSFCKFKKLVYKIINVCNSICHGNENGQSQDSDEEGLPLEISKSMAEKVLVRIDVINKLSKLTDLSEFSKVDQGIIQYLQSNGFAKLSQNCLEAKKKFKIDIEQNVDKFIQSILEIDPSNSIPEINPLDIKQDSNDDTDDASDSSRIRPKIKKKKVKDDYNNNKIKKRINKRKFKSDDNDETEEEEEDISKSSKPKKYKRKETIVLKDDDYDDDVLVTNNDDYDVIEVCKTNFHDSKSKNGRYKKQADDSDDDDIKFTGSHFIESKDDSSNALLPLTIQNNLTIVSLGTVITDRPGFHNDKYIYPAGFISEHLFASTINPNERVWYRSLIIDKGDNGPLFKVELKDDPSVSFEGKNPTNPWMQLVKAVEEAKKKLNIGSHSMTSISGPLYFGLAVPEIKKMIKSLPNASLCSKNIFSTVKTEQIPKLEKNVKTEIKIKSETKVQKEPKARIELRSHKDASSKPETKIKTRLFDFHKSTKTKNKEFSSTKKIHKRGSRNSLIDISSDESYNIHDVRSKDRNSSSSQPYSSPLSDEGIRKDFNSSRNKSKIKHKKNKPNVEQIPHLNSVLFRFDKIEIDLLPVRPKPSYSLSRKAVNNLLREKYHISPNQDPIRYAIRNSFVF